MIEIKLKKRRMLASSSNTNEIYSAIVLFLLYYSVKGKRKSVDLLYITFCLNSVLNGHEYLDNELSGLWDIDDLVKPTLLLLSSYELIRIEYKNSRLLTYITDNGKLHVEEMINEGLFKEIDNSSKELVMNITDKKILTQKLIW